MDSESLLDIIQSRRSVRQYRPDPLPMPLVQRLLEAAAWAPSAHNRQPWRFVVVQTPAALHRLADAMAARWQEEGGARQKIQKRRVRLREAPAAVVLCMSMAGMDTYLDARRQHAERIMAVQSAALAGQNLLLMAHAEGLGACWHCAPLFCPDVVRRVLDLSDDYEPLALITLGYPRGEPAPPKPRKRRTLWR